MKALVNFIFIGLETLVPLEFFSLLLSPLAPIWSECYPPRLYVNLVLWRTNEQNFEVLTYQVLNHEWNILFQIVISCFEHSKAVVNGVPNSFKLIIKQLYLLFKFILVQLRQLKSQTV